MDTRDPQSQQSPGHNEQSEVTSPGQEGGPAPSKGRPRAVPSNLQAVKATILEHLQDRFRNNGFDKKPAATGRSPVAIQYNDLKTVQAKISSWVSEKKVGSTSGATMSTANQRDLLIGVGLGLSICLLVFGVIEFVGDDHPSAGGAAASHQFYSKTEPGQDRSATYRKKVSRGRVEAVRVQDSGRGKSRGQEQEVSRRPRNASRDQKRQTRRNREIESNNRSKSDKRWQGSRKPPAKWHY
jgi:hypothetical protein